MESFSQFSHPLQTSRMAEDEGNAESSRPR